MNKFIILLLLITAFITSHAQKRDESTAMHKFMQANADSTIIVQYTGAWADSPVFYLLSKKGDTLTCYLYKDTRRYSSINKVPRKIAMAMSSRTMMDIYKTPVDINRFFNIKDIQPDSLLKFWDEVSALKPWLIKDDAIEGAGCPVGKKGEVYSIDDGGGILVHLVTKEQIKPLNFYDPDGFEKLCPGRKGRQSIIKFTALFRRYFKSL
ncbi:hypothetical protein [Pedobacter psychrodurus]|uniref:hypothetical protein n=1 Tax=Pedobacter psychrodurus TaxID=2530456 RepID=UPI00292E5D94|nr:hypothetical protein [Pedobacter psychrodurus]